MKTTQKRTGTAASMPSGLAFGAMIATAITILFAAVLAWLVASEVLKEADLGYGVMVILLTASFAGALAAYRKIKRQRLMVCLMSGGIYWAILLSVTVLLFDAQFEAVGVTAFLIFGGCVPAGLLGMRQGRGGRKKKIRLHNR